MDSGAERIHNKIRSFKRKYYLDMFLRGSILSLAILTVYFLIAAILEYNLWLGGWARFVTFLTFFVVAGYCMVRFLREPLGWWLANKGLSEEESARLIGNYIPSVRDRLLNYVQLESLQTNSLASASLLQKTREFEPLSFESVIDLRQNRKYLKYLLIPVSVVLLILFVNRSIITQSAERIIFFSREYSPEAPFRFVLKNTSLKAFYNEDFTITFSLQGSSVPANAYLVTNDLRLKLPRNSDGDFAYTFEKLQRPIEFQIEAAGFFSQPYKVEIFNRPELGQLKIGLVYPRYLNLRNEQLINTGNLQIPEGTQVSWKLTAPHTRNAWLNFGADSAHAKAQRIDSQTFGYERKMTSPDTYEVVLENENSRNRERIAYTIEVIKDQYPGIAVNNLRDSILYQRILLGGMVSDDYGVSQLALFFNVKNQDGKPIKNASVGIPVEKNQTEQNFFFNWAVDSLNLKPGDQLEYYLQVWDNDGVNGRKATRSATYSFHIPTQEDLITNISKSQNQTQEKIDQSVGKASKLQEQIEQAAQKLKGKQSLDWQDKKMLEDLLQQKKDLDAMLKELKEQNKLLEQKKETFTEQDQRIKEKAEQIQKLMDELLDEETKKLFDELQKLLKENTDVNDIQKILNKLNQNADNLEKELERALELFKQAQFDFKMDQMIRELDKEIAKQEEILEKTEQLEQKQQQKTPGLNKKEREEQTKQQSQELAKEQEQLMEDVRQNSDQLKELKELSEDLHNSPELPSEEDQESIMEQQQESKETLENNDPSDSKESQQKAIQQMKQMKQQMQSSQSSMSMEIDMENLESLRHIVHGLVKLSFDQENLMKAFGELTQNDPKFNTIAQNQFKLKDDVKVIEDSLLALGKRDPFLGPVVTREVGELKSHLDKVIEANKERRKPQAFTEMQATMTSINNLALMLDDHFEMMMEMMANAKSSMGKSKKNQKGQKPNLSQLQQQLNQRIEQLKNSGKSGRELSEELAELAAEQERIRKALQQMQEQMQGDSPTPGNQIPGKMEQTEMDLVNKQLTDQLIKRQQEILTRLLDAEKSMREQDLDDERKGETAKEYDKEIPRAFEEYLRLKEKEVELLKTVPPKLYPYYKKEVSDYFKRMGN